MILELNSIDFDLLTLLREVLKIDLTENQLTYEAYICLFEIHKKRP